MIGQASHATGSEADSVAAMKSPSDTLLRERFRPFRSVGLQRMANRFCDQVIEIGRTALGDEGTGLRG